MIYCYSITFFEVIVIVSAIKKIVSATYSALRLKSCTARQAEVFKNDTFLTIRKDKSWKIIVHFVRNDAPFYFSFILTNFLAFVRKRSLEAFSYLVKSNFAYYNGSTYFEPFECIHHHALFLWCLLFFRTLRANY